MFSHRSCVSSGILHFVEEMRLCRKAHFYFFLDIFPDFLEKFMILFPHGIMTIFPSDFKSLKKPPLFLSLSAWSICVKFGKSGPFFRGAGPSGVSPDPCE